MVTYEIIGYLAFKLNFIVFHYIAINKRYRLCYLSGFASLACPIVVQISFFEVSAMSPKESRMLKSLNSESCGDCGRPPLGYELSLISYCGLTLFRGWLGYCSCKFVMNWNRLLIRLSFMSLLLIVYST